MSVSLRTGQFGQYYGNDFNSSNTLTLEQMQQNAQYLYDALSSYGWSKNAICGMLGNFQSESAMNPGRWQSDDVGNYADGYGLAQWTPATKYTDWCSSRGLDPSAMDSAIARLNYELENNEQYYPTSTYPLSFQEFKTSLESPTYLANAFLNNYERPANPNQPARGEQAEYWFTFLEGHSTVWWMYPVTKPYNITQYYSPEHRAIDFGKPENDPIFASRSGKVYFAGFGTADNGFNRYGNVILLNHLDGYYSLYAHCNYLSVSTGDTVNQGQIIAGVGNTGESYGNHLHFEIRDGVQGNRLDPLLFLTENPPILPTPTNKKRKFNFILFKKRFYF